MPETRFEHSKFTYYGGFAFYGAAAVALPVFLALAIPPDHLLVLALYALAGSAGWSLTEYMLHRYVLHGVEPFRTLHAAHHQRPLALIGTPTSVSALLIALLVFLPVWALVDLAAATALTFGVVVAYLAYSVTHHAVHYWRAGNAWSKGRKRWHALHHGPSAQPGYYGVTVGFWDRVFGSDRALPAPPIAAAAATATIAATATTATTATTAKPATPAAAVPRLP